MKVILPKWHDEARRLRSNGMTINQIVLIMNESGINVTSSRVSQVVSPLWERHDVINKTKLEALRTEIAKAKREGRLPDTKAAVREAMLNFRQKEIAMSDRHFEQAFSGVTDKNGVRIRCSAKGCKESMIFARKGVISPVQAARWFRDKGWLVGHNDRSDLCPDHYHPKKETPVTHSGGMFVEEPEMKVNEELTNTTAIPVEPDLKPSVKMVPKENGEDRQMSRMDKRTIHLKLEEVYIDEEVGYRKGWDDETVANNLGVPRAWVAAIRDDSFGPEVSQLSKEKLAALAQVVLDKAAVVQNMIVEIDKLITESDSKWEAMDQRLDQYDKDKADFKAAFVQFVKESRE